MGRREPTAGPGRTMKIIHRRDAEFTEKNCALRQALNALRLLCVLSASAVNSPNSSWSS